MKIHLLGRMGKPACNTRQRRSIGFIAERADEFDRLSEKMPCCEKCVAIRAKQKTASTKENLTVAKKRKLAALAGYGLSLLRYEPVSTDDEDATERRIASNSREISVLRAEIDAGPTSGEREGGE